MDSRPKPGTSLDLVCALCLKFACGVASRCCFRRDTSPNGLSDQGRHPPTAPSPPTDSIQGKSDPTGRRHLQGMPVPGAPEDTYLRPQDTYPHHRIPTPPLSGGIRGMGQPPCTWRSAPGPLAVRCQRHSDNHTPNHTGRVILVAAEGERENDL